MEDRTTLELWYDSILVGRVKAAFFTDERWYGTIELSIGEKDGDVQREIVSFIEFLEEWNEKQTNPKPPPASELDRRYGKLISSDKWFAKTLDGRADPIKDAPVFFVEGQVSWKPKSARY